MKFLDTLIFNAIDGSVSQNSSAIPAINIDKITTQATVTGTSQGTLKIQGSNDTASIIAANGGVPKNWTDIANSTLTLSSATTFILAPLEICHGWIRLVYTQTNASAGTVTATIKTKGPAI